MANQSIAQSPEQRALELFHEKGSEIVQYIDGTYWIPSATKDGIGYHVDIEGSVLGQPCECDHHKFHGAACKHQLTATIKRAKDQAEGRRRSSELHKRARSRQRTRFTPAQVIANLERMEA